jgi:hypothetical protein
MSEAVAKSAPEDGALVPIVPPDTGPRALAIIGEPTREHAGLPAALRRETAHHWRRTVEPLIEAHWPEVRQTPFYRKFQIGAQQVYAPAPYTVVVVCRRRPRLMRWLDRAAAWLRLGGPGLTRSMGWLLPLYTRLRLRRENRRIALMAAFIALADEVFDHHLEHVPVDERAAFWRGLLEGTRAPDGPALSLLRALVDGCYDGCDEAERAELEKAFEGCARWGEAEVARTRGDVDPTGLAHRTTGILTGIDGLAWTVRRHISDDERAWMYAVSEFIQVLDDWVDAAKDARERCYTPVHSGTWTDQTVRDQWDATRRQIGEVVAQNGVRHPPLVQLARDAYTWQVQDLLGHMLSGVAE